MNLTPAQLKQLRTIQGFREKPPTVGWYFRVNWRFYTYVATLCLGAVLLLAWGGASKFSGFFVGFLLAVVTRDFRFFSLFVSSWPLSREITDWRRVDELVASSRETLPNTSLERTREG
jgi:hypothetical protein